MSELLLTERQAIILNEIDFHFFRTKVKKLEHSQSIPDFLTLVLHPNPEKIYMVSVEFSFAHQAYKVRISRAIPPHSTTEKRYEVETIEEVPVGGLNEILLSISKSLQARN
ncbi:hypothetical protein [Leptospira licerasiae]|uniref:hypothetical protein n=1 Tax=Leptospira licerasiae TaxID=447106 RepID=UPI001AEF4BC9|nr:hypothetical protein [Leptospira licerasiae]